MAVATLIDETGYTRFFEEGCLINLRYWQESQALYTMSPEQLNQERDNLIRAIIFALEVELAWPEVVQLIERLSPYMERSGYWEAWGQILSRASLLAEQTRRPIHAVTLVLLQARLRQRQSQFPSAVAAYRQTMWLARQVEDEYSRARACSNLGYLYAEQGRWWRAEILCCWALVVFKRLNSMHGQAHTENHLGCLYLRQGRGRLAEQHLEHACYLWEKTGDSHGLMRGLINLGVLYNEMEYPELALTCLQKALEQAKLTGEEAEIGFIYMNIGISYRLKHEPSQAEVYIGQAEKIFRRFSNLVGLAQVQDNLGLVCLAQEKWLEAKFHFETALSAWRNLASQLGEVRVLIYLIEYEQAKGNHLQALAQLEAVEHLISQYSQNYPDSYWQLLLAKCRRTLKLV